MSKGRRALITGITGQDGSYLAELLLQKDYEVHGLVRDLPGRDGLASVHYADGRNQPGRITEHRADLSDGDRLKRLLAEIQPAEIYHLGAQSSVRASFEMPDYTHDVNAIGTMRLLKAARETGIETRICNAASSEMFGSTPPPQSEESPFQPCSPYAESKLAAFRAAAEQRKVDETFVANAIMFNHESPRRPPMYVTRKITYAAARIRAGLQDKLHLGDLEIRRDWGYAPEYVAGMWRLLQADEPHDLVMATGESHSIRDFVECAFRHAGLDPMECVEVDPRWLRPAEPQHMRGDASKARELIGWDPQVKFEALVQTMVDADINLIDEPAPDADAVGARAEQPPSS